MTIYVLDDGYSGTDHSIRGDLVERNSHGTIMCDTIRIFNPRADIVSIKVTGSTSLMDMIQHLAIVYNKLVEGDIVVFGWIITYNSMLNMMVTKMTHKATVIVPAGNYGDSILNYSPTAANGVHVIAAINHHGVRMSKSNYGDNVKEMYGVPIHHLNITDRGTSVAAAIYAGLISRNKSEKFMRRARKVLHNMFHRGETV